MSPLSQRATACGDRGEWPFSRGLLSRRRQSRYAGANFNRCLDDELEQRGGSNGEC
jgi:hypothetical protein